MRRGRDESQGIVYLRAFSEIDGRDGGYFSITLPYFKIVCPY
jgi:hypothetical protein